MNSRSAWVSYSSTRHFCIPIDTGLESKPAVANQLKLNIIRTVDILLRTDNFDYNPQPAAWRCDGDAAATIFLHEAGPTRNTR